MTMGGLALGDFPAIPIDSERTDRQFARITRGLYFKLYKGLLPTDCRFRILRVDVFRKNRALQVMRDLGQNARRTLGGDIFSCMNVRVEEDPSVSHWLLTFYHTWITVWTNLPDELDPE